MIEPREAYEEMLDLLTEDQRTEVAEQLTDAQTLTDLDSGYAHLAIAAVLLHDHPDKQLAASLRGALWVAIGLPEHVLGRHPVPDDLEGLSHE